MKNFLVSNMCMSNWKEHKFVHANEVVFFLKDSGWTTYQIDWKTPVTGEYVLLFKVENGVKLFENDHFEIPKTFRQIKALKEE